MAEEKRDQRRMPHERRVLLKFSEELGFVGTTRDISPQGAFIEIPHPLHGVGNGSVGRFHLMFDVDRFNYRFKVMRTEGQGVAIHFIDAPDNFVINMLKG